MYYRVPSEQPNVKKRRVLRACDVCRRRKSRYFSSRDSTLISIQFIARCDSMNMADGCCSHCVTLNIACTHTEPSRKRGPPKKTFALPELPAQVSAMADELRQVHPSADASSVHGPSRSMSTPPSDASTPDPLPSNGDDAEINSLAERLKLLAPDFGKNRFFGESSIYLLVRNAISAKEEFTGRPAVPEWKRPEYWVTRPWELLREETPHYIFPDEDLIATLVELYFSNVHPTLPLLHRPTFERAVKDDLHLRDHQFGALLLALLALASRYSDDPRVFVTEANSTLSAGWIFFAQLPVIGKSWRDIPSLYEFQLYCGLGIRFIQDRGEHRRKREGARPTIEGELWNRAFWFDTASSHRILHLNAAYNNMRFYRTPFGYPRRRVCRSSFLSVEKRADLHDSYDVDLPLMVDDEFMENPDPDQAFKQPPGKPSLVTYFVHHIRLCELLDSTIRRLYASAKTRKLMGWDGGEWEQHTVSNLDSAMNEFLDSLPDHLRWDPDRTGVFLDQSAMLHTMYYQLQIMIHRPYIHTTALPFPSLAICTRAARSAINIVDVWLKHFRRVPLAPMLSAPFIFSAILLLNVFGAKRAGLRIDLNKELAYVATAIEALKFWETRYQTAGRARELMNALMLQDDNPRLVPKGSKASKRFDPLAKPYRVEAMSASGPAVQGTSNSEFSSQQASTLPANEQESFAGDIWNESNMSIEEMLAATSQYDRAGADSLATDWGGTGEVGGTVMPAEGGDGTESARGNMNLMPMDEEVMSMWMAAPTNFRRVIHAFWERVGDNHVVCVCRNLDEWDSYIGTEYIQGSHWSTGFEAQGTGFEGPQA
ncbi:hypothetical protein C8R43DRAFT_961308 [Mycena crocata]|nr:hypothetical protein C8R43DRAFT_961308 [Mycena crocata]